MFLVNVCHDRHGKCCADLVPVQPVGMSSMQTRGQAGYVAREAQQEVQSDMLDLLEEDLNRLTVAVSFTQ